MREIGGMFYYEPSVPIENGYIGETNPTDTRTFRDIPITFVNGEVLANSNLAVLEASADTPARTRSWQHTSRRCCKRMLLWAGFII